MIAHERMHKKRLDYIIKPVCYLALILHWFNPLVWLSFCLMIKDMEMSCDEQVLKTADRDIRGAYSRSLLNLSVKGSGLTVPLAFGETNTKERIRHALKYKKPSTWIGIGAILVILAAAVTLLTTGRDKENELSDAQEYGPALYEQLSENRNPYIGDAVADRALIGLLPGLNGYEYREIRLQTESEPYELQISYEKAEPVSVRQEQENADQMLKNAVYLFAAIENMDICTFRLDDSGEVMQTSYTRTELEEIFGDLYEKSETPEGLRELEEELVSYWERMWEYLQSTYE